MSYKPLNEAGARETFSSVYIIDKTCFDDCVLFQTSILKEVRILYPLSP